MKKQILLALITAVLLGLWPACAQSVPDSMQEDFSGGLPEGWLTYAGGDTQITGEGPQGETLLGLRTRTEDAPASVRAASCALAAGERLCIAYTFSVSQTGDFTPERYLKLICADSVASTPTVAVNLANIKGDMLVVGSASTGVRIEQGRSYTIKLAVDTENSTIEGWLGPDRVTSQPVPFAKPAKMDYNACRLMFSNQYANGTGTSDFYIYSAAAAGDLPRVESTPADQEKLVSVERLDKITVCLGTIPFGTPSVRLTRAAPGGGREQPVEAEIREIGMNLEITPLAGFEAMQCYRAVVSGLLDARGNAREDIALSFETAYDGYTEPQVRMTNQKTSGKTGETFLLRAQAQAGYGTLERIEFYVNGGLLTGDSWTPREAGSYEVYAVAYDSVGGSGKSQPLFFQITENLAPEIVFDLENVTAWSRMKSFAVQATDGDGSVALVRVYMDGVLRGEKAPPEPLVFDLSDCALGEHEICVEAEDDNGAVSRKRQSAVIAKIEEVTDKSYDFEDFKDKNPMGGVENKGSFLPVKIDGEHGVSLGIGVDQNTPDGQGGPWTAVSLSAATTSQVVIRFDFYMTLETMRIYFETRGTDADNKAVSVSNFGVSGGSLRLYDGPDLAESLPLSPRRWYTVEYTVFPQEDQYSLAFYSEDGERRQFERLAARSKGLVRFSDMRIYVDGKTQEPQTAAFDNVSILRRQVFPYIKGVYSGAAGEAVDYRSKTLYAAFSDGFSLPDKSWLRLENEIGEVPIQSVEMLEGNLLAITPDYAQDYGFEPANRYRLTLDKRFSLPDGTPAGLETSAGFQTTARPFDVTGGSFSIGAGLAFTAEFVNQTPEARQVTVVMCVYRDGVFQKAVAAAGEVPAGGAFKIKTPEAQWERGLTAKGFVIHSAEDKAPVCNKVYGYQ